MLIKLLGTGFKPRSLDVITLDGKERMCRNMRMGSNQCDFCKVAKINHFSSEINFGQLL